MPEIGDCLDVHGIDMVRPHGCGSWSIVAEATDSAGKRIGKIPIGEISPYADFDPATYRRSWRIRLKMCKELLKAADRRLCVIDKHGGDSILSLKRVLVDERAVSHRRHVLPYKVKGFRSLENLHFHLLKHPLGLGGDEADWPTLLGFPYLGPSFLSQLQRVGCPAAIDYDGKTEATTLEETNVCHPCSVSQKLTCFPLLRTLRNAYEREALDCITKASDRTNPRHYHATEEKRPGRKRATLVFMDGTGRKVVAKGSPGTDDYTTATFFQPDPAKAGAKSEHLRYLKERRSIKKKAREGKLFPEKFCTPLAWGY